MGFRNAVKGEQERRVRRHYELEEQLTDRKTELERLKAELDSLVKLEAEQQQLIHQLSAMEPPS